MPSSAAKKRWAAAMAAKQHAGSSVASNNEGGEDSQAHTNDEGESGGGLVASHALLTAVSALKSPPPPLGTPAFTNSVTKPRTSGGSSKFKAAALALKMTGASTPWGEYAFLSSIPDISSLSNEKLKRHLRAREEVAEGTKQELVARLRNSLEEERQRKLAIELEIEAKHRRVADLEERGAVYVVGKNESGQLGLGDEDDRLEFVVVPSTRGRHVAHASAGGGVTFATTEDHSVYAWGGAGFGPTGLNDNQRSTYSLPQLVEGLNGEEVVATAAGANHACAASDGGDLFVWGFGPALGMEDKDCASARDGKRVPMPRYLDFLDGVTTIECGEMHTCALMKDGEVYTWGHDANGRLGRGRGGPGSDEGNEDVGNPSTPLPVKLPSKEPVRLIACGSEHTILCTRSTVYSFGCGDGGRLGHGPDCADRHEPTEIVSLRGRHALSVSAGTWHSACVVHVPPLDDSGWLYTWGSGFQGQLGLDKMCKVTTPTLVHDFVNDGLSVKEVFCGSHHNAAIVHDGNLYTWGSNRHGALGRQLAEAEGRVPFTPHPGIVSEFGVIVNRIGRGMPRSVACGREYTIVATHAYLGPSEEEALRLAEERRMQEEEEALRMDAMRREREAELQRLREAEAEREKIRYLTSRRLCTMDPNCPGFTYETNQPSVCRECGFSVVYHTIVADDPGGDVEILRP